MTDDALLTTTRGLVNRSNAVTVELLLHLGEIDARQLYLGRAFPSMFAFCTEELGFSEDVAYQRIGVARLARRLPRVLDALRLGQVHIAGLRVLEDVAYNRIAVARLGRRLPSVLDALRAGRVHVTGLRILSPHLTKENVEGLLTEASGKPKQAIEEIAARLAPKPPVASLVRKLPARALPEPTPSLLTLAPSPNAPSPPPAPVVVSPQLTPPPRAIVKPLAEEIFKVQFTARRSLRDKLKELQDLLRPAVPDGDLAEIVERGLDLLLVDVKKQRFAIGRKARTTSTPEPIVTTRHIPDPTKRLVYERDGGQCTFFAFDGRRCAERGGLEFDHADGFARTQSHNADAIRLRCRAHNQFAADKMYGRVFMDEARRKARAREPEKRGRARAGAEAPIQPLLL